MSDLEDSIPDRGEVALLLEYDAKEKRLSIRGYAEARTGQFSEPEKRNVFLAEAVKEAEISDRDRTYRVELLLG